MVSAETNLYFAAFAVNRLWIKGFLTAKYAEGRKGSQKREGKDKVLKAWICKGEPKASLLWFFPVVGSTLRYFVAFAVKRLWIKVFLTAKYAKEVKILRVRSESWRLESVRVNQKLSCRWFSLLLIFLCVTLRPLRWNAFRFIRFAGVAVFGVYVWDADCSCGGWSEWKLRY